MPKGNPAGYLPNVKAAQKGAKTGVKKGGKNPFAMAAQMKK